MSPDITHSEINISDDYSSILLVQYNPSASQCNNWELGSRYTFDEEGFYTVRRTVWDNPENDEQRTLIDVCETPSNQDTSSALDGVLMTNNVTIQDGSTDIGDISKVNPSGERNAIYFTRANLCITVVCYGREDFEIMDWARNIDEDILKIPDSNFDELHLIPSDDTVSVGSSVEIEYSLQWNLGDSGYYKFFATNGNLSLNNNKLIFEPTNSGQAKISGFAIESGKPTFSGQLNLRVS